MGSYTTNYKLFKAATTDFVDVNRDVSSNMQTLDELMFELCQIDINNYSWANQPTVTYANKHTYSKWDGAIRVYDPHPATGSGGWLRTHATASDWLPFASYLYGSWQDVTGYATYYRIINEDVNGNGGDDTVHLELRGRIKLANYAAIAADTNYTICNGMPGGFYFPTGTIHYVNGFNNVPIGVAAMGDGPNATYYNQAHVYITPGSQPSAPYTALLTMTRRCNVNGANAQTPGSNSNYVDLDGLVVSLSRSGTTT